MSVSVCVRDAPLPPSDAHSVQGAAQAADAVGVQTYASSVILCDLLVRCPSAWHQCLEVSSRPKSTWLNERAFRVMELGAGTGIVGMVAAHVVSHIFGQWTNACRPTVYVTDYHADVMKNLFYNVEHYLHVPEEHVDVHCMTLCIRSVHTARASLVRLQRHKASRFYLLQIPCMIPCMPHGSLRRSCTC